MLRTSRGRPARGVVASRAEPRAAFAREGLASSARAMAAWPAAARVAGAFSAVALACGCTTVDPGPNFVVADEQFDESYFFCHVEPELLIAKRCGPGDPAAGDPPGGCHFSPSAGTGMILADHPPVDCGGGDTPLSRAQIGAGSLAQGNLQAATLAMSRDYRTAPLYVRPTGANHPRAVLSPDDPVFEVLRTWAARP